MHNSDPMGSTSPTWALRDPVGRGCNVHQLVYDGTYWLLGIVHPETVQVEFELLVEALLC